MNFTAILTFLLSLRVDDYLKSKTVGESTSVFLNLLKKTKSEHQQKLHMRNASKCREGEEQPRGRSGRSLHEGLPRREAWGRREGGGPRHWLLWGTVWVSGGWKLWGACLCDQGSFSVPRFPYRLCLRSRPPHRSLSAWKPCSATSGSCSILPVQGRPPSCRPAGLRVQRLSRDCLQTGQERYPQSSIRP